MKTTTWLGAALVALCAATPALANKNPPSSADNQPHVPPYTQIDSDGDGKLSAKEFEAATRDLNITLAQLDTNKDGNVSRGEWDDYRDGVKKNP